MKIFLLMVAILTTFMAIKGLIKPSIPTKNLDRLSEIPLNNVNKLASTAIIMFFIVDILLFIGFVTIVNLQWFTIISTFFLLNVSWKSSQILKYLNDQTVSPLFDNMMYNNISKVATVLYYGLTSYLILFN